MTPEALSLYREVKATSQSTTLKLDAIKKMVQGLETRDLVDSIYVLREVVELTNTIKKEAEKVRKILAKVGVLHCDAFLIEKVQTAFCTGKPQETSEFSFPHKRDINPEQFDTIMRSLGIPKDVYEKELVRLHWPEFQKYCQALLADAKNPPAGIDPDKSFPVYDFSIVKKRGVSIDGGSAMQDQIDAEREELENQFSDIQPPEDEAPF